MKRVKLATAIAFFINTGVSYPTFAVSEIISETKINIKATITADSCTVVNEDSHDFYVDLGQIPIKDISNAGNDGYAVKNVALTYNFSCDVGSHANFTLHAAASDLCVGVNGANYVCSGENKTVGIRIASLWADKDNVNRSVWVSTLDSVRTVKLNEQMKGEIKLINPPYSVNIMRIKDQIPKPGTISAQYILKIWSE